MWMWAHSLTPPGLHVRELKEETECNSELMNDISISGSNKSNSRRDGNDFCAANQLDGSVSRVRNIT